MISSADCWTIRYQGGKHNLLQITFPALVVCTQFDQPLLPDGMHVASFKRDLPEKAEKQIEEVTTMTPEERELYRPYDVDEAAWREAEEDLLAQAREVSRKIIERVRILTAPGTRKAEGEKSNQERER
jgi:hypothetical protein